MSGLGTLAGKNAVAINSTLLQSNGGCAVGIEFGALVEVEVNRIRLQPKSAYVSFNRTGGITQLIAKNARGIHMACLVPILSATLPRIAGPTAPPQTEATRKDAPRLV